MNELLFDYAAHRYEVSGDALSQDALAYLEEIQRVLQKYEVSFPGLYLDGKEIRAAQGGNIYTLGTVYTQGTNAQRIIYPCFRDEFVFDFAREIPSFSLWKGMDAERVESYTKLKSYFIKDAGAEAHRISFALTQDFVALCKLDDDNFRAKRVELDFLKGLLSLYQVGLAQARIRAFHGVSLASLVESGTTRRRKRAVEHVLNLLVGDDVADVRLYRVIAAQSPASIASMHLIYKYNIEWKGRINTREDFSSFLLSTNLWLMPPALFAGLPYLNELRTQSVPHILGSLPPVGSAEWNGMLVSLHGEFELFRRRELGSLLRPGGRHYLELGADYSISNNELVVKYSAPAAEGVSFDGIVNVVGHGRDIEKRVFGHPEKVAEWLYSNILNTYTASGFKKLRVVNFQSCHVSHVAASNITCLLLERALVQAHLDKSQIPNVLVVSSPRAPLVLTSDWVLGPLSSKWQDHHLVLPGLVLKAFRYLIDASLSPLRPRRPEDPPNTWNIQVAIRENFEWSDGPADLNNLSFVDYLKRTHVLEVGKLSANERHVSHMDEMAFDAIRRPAQAAANLRKSALDGLDRLINDKFSDSAETVREMLAIASIEGGGGGGLLPIGEVETMRKVVDFLLRLKAATDRGDSVEGLLAYTGTKVKFLIDPYDPHGAQRIRAISNAILKFCGSTVPSSESNYKSAYEKFFLLSKQEYWEMTGINIDSATREFFKNIPYGEFPPSLFREFQTATPKVGTLIVDNAIQRSLLGSEQLGVSTRELRGLLEIGDETKILPALEQLENQLNSKKALLKDSASLKGLQDTQEQLDLARNRLKKQQLSARVLKTSARVATGTSRLLGAFGVFADFRTQPFQLDFSSARSGVFSVSDSLAVVKGVFDFTTDVGPAVALRLASSASRALWQPRLDQLFFKLNKVLLPLDVLFTAVSLYRNIEGAQLAKTAEEQALYITMTVIDGVAFGVNLAAFILIGVPGVNVVLILVGAALTVVNIILNAIVSLSQLENYRWNEKVSLFFRNMFGSSALEGILTQQQMRQVADQLFDGRQDPGTGIVTAGLHEDGIDLFLTPMINDADDDDQTNPLKDIGSVSQEASLRQEPRGYTLSPLGLAPNDLKTWPDGKGQGKHAQVCKGWYLRRREARRGRERKLMVTMPSTPNKRLEVLDFGPIPTVLLFGATPHLLLNVNPFGWATGESPQEQALNKYQVKLYPETSYTLQFKKSLMASKDFDSNFGSRTELLVPQGPFQTLPRVSLDLSGQEDARETIAELDLSLSSLEVTKFKGKSTFKLELVTSEGQACALEQVVRTVQLPAYIRFKSGETHPVMAVVGEASRITLRNSTGRSLLLLRRETRSCEVDIQAAVSGFAVSI